MKLDKVGFGTWLITDPKTIDEIIKEAVKTGYRHFDTAQAYNNEYQIGTALKESGVPREDFFITTKVAFQNVGYHAYESTKQSINRLQTDYIDLMILHAHVNEKYDLEGYRQLIQAREEGLVKNIGVSNFSIENIEAIYNEFGEYPAVNQIVVSPVSRIIDLENYCKERNIELVGYSIIKPYYEQNPFYAKFTLSDDDKKVLEDIASSNNQSVARVLNKWALQHGYNIIPKTVKVQRLEDNFKYDFELSDEDMKKIDQMNKLSSSDKYQEKIEEFKLLFDPKLSLEDISKTGLLFEKNY